jgi:putative heme transporter
VNKVGGERPENRSPRRGIRRQVVQIAVSVALIVVVFVAVLPEVADFDQVWAAIRGMTSIELVSLGLAGAWNLVTGWFVPMASLPGLSLPKAMLLVQSSTAVANTVPAGSAVAVGLSASMLRSWGFRRSIVTLSLVITGIWDNLTKLALPVAALTGLLIEGEDSGPLVTAALLGAVALVAAVIVFALMLRSEQAAAQIGVFSERAASFFLRLVRRPPATGWDIATTRFRSKTIGLLRARWLALTAASLASHLSLYVVLLLALRHVGASEDDVGWAEVLAVFAFVRLLSAIPLTPGGLGVVELALTAGLVGAGGPRAEVVAAILVYRGLTYLVPVPLGALTYLGWRQTVNRSAIDRPEIAVQEQHGSG